MANDSEPRSGIIVVESSNPGSPGHPDSEFSRRISKAVIETCGPSIVAICANFQKKLHQMGTGTLLRIAERYFLVTAAHVIKDAEKALGAVLVISDIRIGENCPQIPLAHMQAWMVRDKLDVAIIELPADAMKAMPNRRCIDVSDFDRRPLTPDDTFYVWGYPTSEAPQTPEGIAPLAVGFTTVQKTAEPDSTYDPKLHLMFEPPDGTEIADDGVRMPARLEGISGCAVWRVHSGESPESWTPSNIKLTAIQTRVRHKWKDEAVTGKLTGVQATHWQFVARIIWESMPQLRPSLSLFLPD